jgi:FKBP-type peptidyl-prolyl cis-trans isomerase SlyD
MQIAKHTVVSIHYTLRNAAGEVLESSRDAEPLAYLHGVGGIIPGLETALEGKGSGESVRISVPPTEAYGERDEGLIQSVPKDRFSGVERVEPGMQFHAETDGGPRTVTVTGVEGETVTVDANHPLAGETLDFDVEVLEVREATSEEIDHGHAHGPGGHAHG